MPARRPIRICATWSSASAPCNEPRFAHPQTQGIGGDRGAATPQPRSRDRRVHSRAADQMARAVDRGTQRDGRRDSRRADMERRQRAQPRLGRRPQGARIGPVAGIARQRGQPAAEPDSPLYQSAEPAGADGNSRDTRGSAQHASQPRRDRSHRLRFGRRVAVGDRAIPAGIRRGARPAEHDQRDLRKRGAQAGAGNGRPIPDHRGRH